MRPIVLVALVLILGSGIVGCERFDHVGPAPYDKPPADSMRDALAKYATALNQNDSVAFLTLNTWESRTDAASRITVRTMWDSTRGSTVGISLIDARQFKKHVRSVNELALYGQARIAFWMHGARSVGPDTLVALLRVDSGAWRVNCISIVPDEPFRGMSARY